MPEGYSEPFAEQQEFDTHLSYISALRTLTDSANLTINQRILPKPIPDLNKKKNLIDLTIKSLNDEYEIVKRDADYSYASMSWLPIKSYYLLFNILLTIEYLIKVDSSIFSIGHQKCIEEYTRKLRDKELEFDVPILSKVFDRSIFALKYSPGLQLSNKTDIDLKFNMLIKKASLYKLDTWKRQQKINNFRNKSSREKKDQYLNSFTISIFEFSYYMRIRCNYRDMAFIENVSKNDTKKYFEEYMGFTKNMCRILLSLRKTIACGRLKGR
ncbi:MAG: hypothetical protein WCX95_01815 [Candidatus Gracilibacteria bacterium]